jgi:gliding motility-associated-like protein
MDLEFEVRNTAPEIVNAQIAGQTLTISFRENQSGIAFLTIKCTDTKGAFVEHELQLVIQPVNDSPIFETTEITSAEEGVLYEYPIITSDVEDDDRGISLLTSPAWIWLNDNGDGTASLTGTPTNDDLGDHLIEIVVAESISGLSSSQIFTINVNNVNDTPRFVSQPPLEVAIGRKYSYQIEISDPDPDDTFTVAVDVTTLPTWLVLNTTTLKLEGFPPEGSEGLYENIKLIVWDEAGAAREQVFNITVSSPNTPPTITGGYAESIEEDEILIFSADAFKDRVEDPDASDTLVAIIITELPENGTLSYNGNSVNANDTIPANEIQNLNYTPNNNYFGLDLIIWKASDGKSTSNEGRITITISSIDDPPQITELETSSIIYEFGDFNVNVTQSAEVLNDGIIAFAVFSIVNNYNRAQDSLSIASFDGITSSWNDTTGVLTVIGAKSESVYTQIIRSLIYTNQKRFAPSIETRTIELKVSDSELSSEAVMRSIEFEDSFVELVIPTGFTPNDTPPNDLWEIENIEAHEDAIVRIYSRSGNRMYESVGLYKPWDGKYNGDYVKTGVYYYTIEIPKFERKYSGTITVLR